MSICGIVLTRNEQDRIEKCLRSLSWCDEILVIDDFSKDQTIEKIGEIRDIQDKITIIQKKSDNDMSEIRNFAMSKAKSEWLFFVDADEVVPEKLREEIKVVSKVTKDHDNDTEGYFVPRRDFFMGRFLKYGETGNIKLLRLGKKSSGKWSRKVHETWKLDGNIGNLSNYLEHYSHPSIKQFIDSINRWTDLDVGELNKEGKSFSFIRVFFNPVGKFIQNYFIRLGILDGFSGFVMAFMMSFQSLIVRVKQFEYRNNDLSRPS